MPFLKIAIDRIRTPGWSTSVKSDHSVDCATNCNSPNCNRSCLDKERSFLGSWVETEEEFLLQKQIWKECWKKFSPARKFSLKKFTPVFQVIFVLRVSLINDVTGAPVIGYVDFLEQMALDLWSQKQLLYQLSHNDCPRSLLVEQTLLWKYHHSHELSILEAFCHRSWRLQSCIESCKSQLSSQIQL